MSKKTVDKAPDVSQTEKKPKSKARKVLSIIGNILMWAFIVFSVVITIFAFSAQSNSDGIPTIAGKVMSPVLSPSMEPTIKKGDLIFTTKLSDEEKTTLKEGDIITFKVDLDGDGKPEVNTHRIKEVIGSGAFVSYKTKGDNNAAEDNYDVAATDVISVFKEGESLRLPFLGSLISFLLTPTGFFVIIVIPLILFFLFEIVMFVRKILEVKGAGKKQITAEDEELIKKKAIEEYLRQQQQQQQENGGAPEKTEATLLDGGGSEDAPDSMSEPEAPEEAPDAPAESGDAPAESGDFGGDAGGGDGGDAGGGDL